MLALASGLFGLLIGSFLNVVAHRLPRGQSLIKPRSQCPACEREILSRDNVPVVSWLLLRGRCRWCRVAISARYPFGEAMTGALFAAASIRFGLQPILAAFLILFSALVAITLTDLDLRLIPKIIVWPTYGLVLAVLLTTALIDGDAGSLVRAVAGSLAAFAVLFAIHFISPRGMGFGDVRLGALLGLGLGWLGWGHVALGLFAGFLFGGIAGVAALAAGRSRKSALPFGPFLALGTVVAVLAGQPVVDWYLTLLR